VAGIVTSGLLSLLRSEPPSLKITLETEFQAHGWQSVQPLPPSFVDTVIRWKLHSQGHAGHMISPMLPSPTGQINCWAGSQSTDAGRKST
jgi:hypothetical protein